MSQGLREILCLAVPFPWLGCCMWRVKFVLADRRFCRMWNLVSDFLCWKRTCCSVLQQLDPGMSWGSCQCSAQAGHKPAVSAAHAPEASRRAGGHRSRGAPCPQLWTHPLPYAHSVSAHQAEREPLANSPGQLAVCLLMGAPAVSQLVRRVCADQQAADGQLPLYLLTGASLSSLIVSADWCGSSVPARCPARRPASCRAMMCGWRRAARSCRAPCARRWATRPAGARATRTWRAAPAAPRRARR